MLNNWVSTYQFNDSIFLWALILVPIAILLYALLKIKNRESLQISSLTLFSGLGNGYLSYINHVKFGIKLFALALLIIGMARPQISMNAHTETEHKGRNRYCYFNGCIWQYACSRFFTKSI